MSLIEINIRVNGAQASRELDRVSRGARKAGASTDAFTRELSKLRRVMGFLGFSVLLSGLTEYADGLVEAQNRLRFFISDQEKLTKTTQDLKRVADSTRSGFLESVTLYQRMSLAARQLGVAQDDLLGITKSINQAIILSGASAKEANNGLIQLSQGIAANRLGGDELRSVLEQPPVVADTIARELGVTRGELRAMGEQGKITGNVVIDAFKNAAELLDAEFGETIPTIGQSLNVLKNNIIGVLGELNASTGIFGKMSVAVMALAKNLKAVGLSLLATFGPVAYSMVNRFFMDLQASANAALTSVTKKLFTMRGAINAAFGAIVIAGMIFRNDIKLTEDSTVSLGDTVEQTFTDAAESIRIAGGMAVDAFANLTTGMDLSGIQFGLQDALLFFGVFADTTANIVRGVVAEVANGLQALPVVGVEVGLAIKNGVLAGLEALKGQVSIILNGLSAAIGMFGAALEQTFKGNFVGANEMNEQAMVTLRGAFDAAGKSAANQFNKSFGERMEADRSSLDIYTTEIAEVGTLLGSAMGDQATTYVQDAISDMMARAQQRVDAADVADQGREARLARLREEAQILKETSAVLVDVTQKYRQQGDLLMAQIQGGQDYANVLKAVYEAERRIEKASKGRETLSEDTRKAIVEQVEYNNQLARVAELMEQVNGPQRELVANQQALKMALDDGVISLREFHAAMLLLKEESGGENSFAAGLADGLEQVRNRVFDLTTSTSNAVQNVAQATEDFLAGSIQTTTNFIAKLVEGGKVSFADFRDTIRSLFADLITAMIQELSRLMAQRMMMQLFGMMAGSAAGLAPGFTGESNAFNPDFASPTGNSMAFPGGRAIGGTAIANKPYLVGENGPEMFFPGRTGSIMTNQQSLKAMEQVAGGRQSAPAVNVEAPQVNVSPQIVLDPSQVVSRGLNDDMIVQAVSRNANAIRGTLGQ